MPAECKKRILRAGEYEAILSGVKDATSKRSGNPMWVVTWTVLFPSETNEIGSVKVLDYIVKPKPWKLEMIARAWGKLPEYESGRFELRDYLEAHIGVVLAIEAPLGFEQRNTISGYRAPKGE